MHRLFSKRGEIAIATRLIRSGGQDGFTLVELLVVILIVAILATIAMFAFLNATEAGRQARTRAQIEKIHQLITPIWESYNTRRVDIGIPPGIEARLAAELRLDALREIMRLELPDRITDVTDNPITLGLVAPSRNETYKYEVNNRAGSMDAWTPAYQSAECLFLIVIASQDDDSNALEYFRPNEIGDLDNDGVSEILDGWGNPISFLRWPAGFTADVANTPLQKAPAQADPDPFDHLRVRGSPPNTYFLYPLIVSAGPDGIYDLNDLDTPDSSIHYTDTVPPNDPFANFSGGKIGAILDNGNGQPNQSDNVHNHLLEVRP